MAMAAALSRACARAAIPGTYSAWSVAVDLRIFSAHHDPLNDIDAYQACADQHADVRRGQLRAGRHQQRARSRHGTLRFNIFPGRDRLYALHEIGRLWFSQP